MAVGFLRKENVAQRGEVTRPRSPALGGGPRPKPWTAWNGPNEGLSGRRREASPQQDRDPLLKWQPPGRAHPCLAPTKDIPRLARGRQSHPVTPTLEGRVTQ